MVTREVTIGNLKEKLFAVSGDSRVIKIIIICHKNCCNNVLTSRLILLYSKRKEL